MTASMIGALDRCGNISPMLLLTNLFLRAVERDFAPRLPQHPKVGRSFHAFDDFDFLRRQAVERIHQLVYLALQRARVRLGLALLRRKDAVNQSSDSELV